MNSQATSVTAWRRHRSAIAARLVNLREIDRMAFWEFCNSIGGRSGQAHDGRRCLLLAAGRSATRSTSKAPPPRGEVRSNRQIARRWHLRACRFAHARDRRRNENPDVASITRGYVTFVFDLQMCIQHDLGHAVPRCLLRRGFASERMSATMRHGNKKKDFGRTPS